MASEVKELANQTARATEEITGHISRIQGATGGAVTAIDGIRRRIQEISGVASSIAASVLEQGAATQEIVRNVSEAAAGTAEVTSNVVGVARASEETGAAATQVLTAASDLSQQSEHLGGEVSRFLSKIRVAGSAPPPSAGAAQECGPATGWGVRPRPHPAPSARSRPPAGRPRQR